VNDQRLGNRGHPPQRRFDMRLQQVLERDVGIGNKPVETFEVSSSRHRSGKSRSRLCRESLDNPLSAPLQPRITESHPLQLTRDIERNLCGFHPLLRSRPEGNRKM
jgi:hypothetical protein